MLHTEPDLLSIAEYLIDPVLYEAKVKNPALRFVLPCIHGHTYLGAVTALAFSKRVWQPDPFYI